jgi:aldose 1-epimerase
MYSLPDAHNFNTTYNNKKIGLWFLENETIKLAITNYGARMVSLLIKDNNGAWIDIIVGPDSFDGFLNTEEQFFGAVVGRNANRIEGAKFIVDHKEYSLIANDNHVNHLHGGPNGFHKQVWELVSISNALIVLQYVSPHLEEGYPGELTTQVAYHLIGNSVQIQMQASTNIPTVCNLTHHNYFNLNGVGAGSIMQHQLQLNAQYYTPVNNNLIPTGQLATVANTPFDFTNAKAFEAAIDFNDAQIKLGNGFDHNYALNNFNHKLQLAAIATGNVSGIKMELHTNMPGMQLYTANWLNANNIIKQNKQVAPNHAFCIEPQFFPNHINEPNFISGILLPTDKYQHQIQLNFN